MARVRGLPALVLLAPLLATGCVAPRVEAATVSLTFACHNHEVLHYRALAEEFQAENPAIVIRLASLEEIAAEFPEHPLGEIGRAAGAVDAFAGRAPDDDAVLGDVLLDLASYAAEEGLTLGGDLYAGAAAPFTRDGKLWGLPHQAHAYVVYYDPSAFESAGLPVPAPGWTRDDLLRAALTTSEREDGIVRRYGFVDRWPGYTAAALAGRVAAAEGASPELDRAELAEVLVWYADLVRVHGVSPDPSAPEASEEAEALLMGERPPAMWTGHSFEAGRFRRRYGARVAPLPQGTDPAAPISVDGYMVSARTMYPDLAWRWIEFLSRQPSEAYYGGIMARRSAAYWDELDESTATAFRYCLEHGVYYGPAVWTPMQSALLDLLSGASLGQAIERGPWTAPEAGVAGAGASASDTGELIGDLMLPETGAADAVAAEAAHVRFAVRTREDARVYRTLADRFSLEQEDVVVEVVEAGESADEPADCFVAGTEVGSQGNGDTLPLERFLPQTSLRDAFPPALLEPLSDNDHVWGLPLDADARVLLYNRELFDERGLARPSSSWRAYDLLEHATLLTDAEAQPPRYGYWPRGGAEYRAAEMIAWLGGALLDADGTPTLDTPTALGAVRRYAGLIALSPPAAGDGAVTGGAEGDGLLWGAYPAVVERGQVAMWLDDYGSARQAMAGNPAMGMAALPLGAVTPPPRVERALYIDAGAAHPEECWRWLWYLAGRPEAASLFPARLDVAASDAWRLRVGDETAETWLATLRRGTWDDWGPYSDGTLLRWVNRAFSQALQGADPAEVLAGAQKATEAYVECMVSSHAPVTEWTDCVRVVEQGDGE